MFLKAPIRGHYVLKKLEDTKVMATQGAASCGRESAAERAYYLSKDKFGRAVAR
jgi:hypothetical protein